jgi:hypothetical protein
MKSDKPCQVFDLMHKGILGGNKFNYWIDEDDVHTIFSRKHINWLLDNLKGKNVEIIIREFWEIQK